MTYQSRMELSNRNSLHDLGLISTENGSHFLDNNRVQHYKSSFGLSLTILVLVASARKTLSLEGILVPDGEDNALRTKEKENSCDKTHDCQVQN